jgi:uncharacterized protein (TIGR03435 family)
VDSVDQKPTANQPDVEKNFPPVPTEFDAAEIKPSPPGQLDHMMPEIKNGRVILPNMNLQTLVWLAWDLNPNDEVINAPKWYNTDHFDVIAKAPAGVALGDIIPTNSRTIPLNIDALRPMLRSLLTERFKMAVHMEDRPKNVSVLMAAKPKLATADPAGRTKYTSDNATDAKGNPNAALGRKITVHNMTMAQFALVLPEFGRPNISQVVDATGLEGHWDFTFTFTQSFVMVGPAGGSRGGDGPQDTASDPTGGMTLADALSKQLGLKLETQKRPLPALVIDHIEPKPTEN